MLNSDERRSKKRHKKILQLRMDQASSGLMNVDSDQSNSEDQKEMAGLSRDIEDHIDAPPDDIEQEITAGNSTLDALDK